MVVEPGQGVGAGQRRAPEEELRRRLQAEPALQGLARAAVGAVAATVAEPYRDGGRDGDDGHRAGEGEGGLGGWRARGVENAGPGGEGRRVAHDAEGGGGQGQYWEGQTLEEGDLSGR